MSHPVRLGEWGRGEENSLKIFEIWDMRRAAEKASPPGAQEGGGWKFVDPEWVTSCRLSGSPSYGAGAALAPQHSHRGWGFSHWCSVPSLTTQPFWANLGGTGTSHPPLTSTSCPRHAHVGLLPALEGSAELHLAC